MRAYRPFVVKFYDYYYYLFSVIGIIVLLQDFQAEWSYALLAPTHVS